MDQEQLAIVFEMEPDVSSTSDAVQDNSNINTNTIIESTSTNSDDESNSIANCMIQLQLNNENSDTDECDNKNDENNVYISTTYETEDQYYEDEQIEEETPPVENFCFKTVSNNMFQADTFATVSESNDQNLHKTENEFSTTQSDTLDQVQLLNTSTVTTLSETTVHKDDALSTLNDKLTSTLEATHYPSEIAYVRKKLAVNILLVGPARVGKSSLVNALTGNTKKIAKTAATLESCTQVPDQYEVCCESLKDVPEDQKCKVYIWDTKGIEDWGQQSGANSMFQFIEDAKPICVIFCAASGALAKLDQVRILLDYCHWRKILCATILTNMWSGKS